MRGLDFVLYLAADFCLAYQGMIDGMVEEINPEYKWSPIKLVSGGDSVCRWIVEIKEAVTNVKILKEYWADGWVEKYEKELTSLS